MPNSDKKSSAPKPSDGAPPASPPELVLVMRGEAAMRASAGRFEALSGASTNTLASALADHGATISPMFGPTEERIIASSQTYSSDVGSQAIDMAAFYTVAAAPEALEALQSDLIGQDLVDGAYVKPGCEPAAFMNDMAPSGEEAPPTSPDFSSRQIYLDAAPAGVEARWAWTQAGGRGAGINIIDIEGAWRFTHEDLVATQGGVVGGTMSTDIGWRNHGTAVLGEFSGDTNGYGIQGIASDAVASAISIFGGPGSAGAINAAAARLGPGDVILIELHRPGPRHAFAGRSDQRGYVAIEWWPDDFAAIRNAVNRGIIVVEAAGNGAENLDDAIYQTAAAGFPAGWSNSFRRSNRDSGAIMVGAGAPPPGTHGRNHGVDRSRLDFSNWGALIDTQGWGREVTTAGYGDLQGGANEDLWYTDTFSGTSSASPIIVGVAASLQGMARARGRPFLTPARFRECLRSTGSAQQDEPGRPATQRIGTRPNLRQLSVCAFGVVKLHKEHIKEFKEVKEGKETVKEIRKEISKENVKENIKEQIKEIKERKEFIKENVKENVKEIEKRLEKRLKEKDKDKDKDKDKEMREGGWDIRDRVIDQGNLGGGVTAGVSDLENRLSGIEAAIEQLAHFIGSELRPDLSASALGQADQEAKDYKDQKDSESY
jgi:Subtilase family